MEEREFGSSEREVTRGDQTFIFLSVRKTNGNVCLFFRYTGMYALVSVLFYVIRA